MSNIIDLKALEILDSRGNPTVEVELITQDNSFVAAVPSGASTGDYEAVELRDNAKRYLGKGVRKAVNNVERKIASKIKGMSVFNQFEIDSLLIDFDKTSDKHRLGANAILGVSLAAARAGADAHGMVLLEYIKQILSEKKQLKMPRPFFNVINGGKHAGNNLPFQEFMISPKTKRFKDALRIGSEVYHTLKKVIEKKYGKNATNVGDEGGFAPPIKKAEDAFDLLKIAIRKAGYTGKVEIAMDCAASEFYVENKKLGKVSGYYQLHKRFTRDQLIDYYLKLIRKYKIISMEDPFDQEDYESFAKLNKEAKKYKCQIVGDDLTVTNVERIRAAIDDNSCNCLLLKVNQIGTLSEAIEAVRLAYNNGWKIMVSHRSGETEDSFIADLAVGIGCGQIKAGAPCRGERTAKYNQLLRIERFLREEGKIR